ncbi:hypothetical protein RKD21_003283 [Streptomyces albogriseolus]|uniref:Uncharacterized protein n=1 Tax=Streptomyces albogriseolus TaxID=1887 RepID=A0ACC6UP02_STRAO
MGVPPAEVCGRVCGAPRPRPLGIVAETRPSGDVFRSLCPAVSIAVRRVRPGRTHQRTCCRHDRIVRGFPRHPGAALSGEAPGPRQGPPSRAGRPPTRYAHLADVACRGPARAQSRLPPLAGRGRPRPGPRAVADLGALPARLLRPRLPAAPAATATRRPPSRVPGSCLPCRRLAVPAGTAACRPCRRLAAPAGTAACRPCRCPAVPAGTATRGPPRGCPVHACRAAAWPSRRVRLPAGAPLPGRPGGYGYPQAGPVVPGPCPLRRHRPVPAATAPGPVPRGPGPLRSTGVASGVCGPRPRSTAAGSAGAVAGGGASMRRPALRSSAGTALPRLIPPRLRERSQERGRVDAAAPCRRRAADTPGPHRHRCPEDRYQRNVRIRIACRSRAAFAFRGCTRSRNARASASSLRNRARRRRRSASQSTSPPPASAPSPTLEAPAVPESRSARDPRPARADGFPRFCCSGIASSPQSVPPTFPRPDDLTPAKG